MTKDIQRCSCYGNSQVHRWVLRSSTPPSKWKGADTRACFSSGTRKVRENARSARVSGTLPNFRSVYFSYTSTRQWRSPLNWQCGEATSACKLSSVSWPRESNNTIRKRCVDLIYSQHSKMFHDSVLSRNERKATKQWCYSTCNLCYRKGQCCIDRICNRQYSDSCRSRQSTF